MVTEAQRRAYAKYRAEGKTKQIHISLPRSVMDDIAAYAKDKGMSTAMCARECVRRCMELDGWAHPGANHPGANRTEPTASDPSQVETVSPGSYHVEPVKRKRGRPRKVQAVDIGADGTETDAHNNADAVGVDADTIAPPRRKRGRPRKVKP